VVLRAESAKGSGYGLAPSAVLLAVEVLSPTSRGRDLLVKRHEYAAAGIPDYWIVDREHRRLTVLSLDEGGSEYAMAAEITAGTTHRTGRPFTLELDPDEVC
jgi:Uma2 family endonuclease